MDGTRSASIYTSLKDDEFRLLSLIARGNDDGLIELKLSTHNLNTAPPYGKLSYIWGTHKADKTLRLNGHNVQVTSDLHAAIRHIWNSGEPELLFIDKLCINQKDLEEQNVQVRLLDRIIRNANRVHVWLGEEHESTQSAMQSLALFGASSLTLEDGIAAVAGGRISLADVRKLLSHPWFMRLWSAQEIGLARDIRVYQGISCIQWNSLIQGASGVAKLEESYSGQVLIPNWRTRRLLFHVKHSLGLSLGTLVSRMAALEVTQPSDKIYALCSLAGDSASFLLEDHSISVEMLYNSFVQWHCSSTRSLDIILQPWSSTASRLNVPSWVPDWTCASSNAPVRFAGRRHESQARSVLKSQGSNALGHLELEINWSFEDSNELHVKGYAIDHIDQITSPWAKTLPVDWLELGKNSPAFWRALVAYRSFDGSMPTHESLGGLFDTALAHKGESVEPVKFDHVKSSRYDGMHPVTFSRSLAETRRSRSLALVPGNAKVGDAICILHGCSVPVILRPHNGVYQLVGESYVDGIMHGEVLMAGIKDSTIIIDPSRVEPLSMDNLLDQASQEDPDLNITEQEIEETPGQSLSSQCSQSSPAQAIPRAGSPTEDATRTEPLVEDTPMAGSTLEAKPRFRVTWKSPGGYRGVDTLTELVPSSMQRYVDELREDGFIAEMSAIDAEAKELEAVKTALLSTHASICTGITSLWSAMSKHTSSTTSLASQPPSLPPFPATSTAGQASNQPPHQITPQNNSQIVSGAAQPTTSQATTQANQQTTSQNNQDDKKRFLVLCLKKGIYHRYRKHLDVTNIKSDQELFTEMQQEYSVERNWAKKWLSLKSVKSITFVVVALWPNNVVGINAQNELPGKNDTHYDFEPRKQRWRPPIADNILMLYFTTPSEARDITRCWKQFPKRIGQMPDLRNPPGPPDWTTAWGIQIEEGYDMGRIFVAIVLGVITSGIFGIVWAAVKDMGDGFQVAGWIVSSWALGVMTLQFVIN